MTALAPSSMALATATTMPRSLNEPVGFWPSILRYSCGTPMARPSLRACTSGVKPSPRPSGGVSSVRGRKSAKRSIRRGRRPVLDCSAWSCAQDLAHAHGLGVREDGIDRDGAVEEPQPGGHRGQRAWACSRSPRRCVASASSRTASGKPAAPSPSMTTSQPRSPARSSSTSSSPGRRQQAPRRAGAVGQRQHVGEDGARGGRAAGAGSGHGHAADRIGVELDDVGDTAGRAQRSTPAATAMGVTRRVHRRHRPARRASHQLDGHAQAGGHAQVAALHAGDALGGLGRRRQARCGAGARYRASRPRPGARG